MKAFLKKSLTLLTALTLALSAGGCSLFNKNSSGSPVSSAGNQEVQQAFDEFLLEEARKELSTDGLTVQFSLVNPTAFGIADISQTLGEITEEEDAANRQDTQASLAALQKFKRTDLTETQQLDYDLYEQALKDSLSVQDYNQLQFLFEPNQGLVAALNQNFLEFRLETEQDIEFYLTLLADVERYMTQALDYTKKQAKKGYFLQDTALDSALEEIDRFLEKTDDNALVVNFSDKLKLIDGLSDESRQNYEARNLEIMRQQYLPVYQKTRDTLESLRGSAKGQGGLTAAYGKEGTAYYQLLMQSKSGTNQTIEELVNEIEDYMIVKLMRIQELMQADPDLLTKMENFEFTISDAAELLKLHEENMTLTVPAIPKINYSVDILDASIASENTIAYYLIPPLDEPKDNVIKVNPAFVDDLATLYQTTAHEGFPGHLYQQNYYQNTNPSPIRRVISEIAYTEGWAEMAGMDSYRWAGIDDENVIEALQINSMFGYYLQCICDIAVNGLGYSQEDLTKYLANFGYDSAAVDIFNGVVENPGALLPYGVGHMKMETLRTQAKEALGEKYSDQEFYTVILNNGPRPFDQVGKDIDAYIAANK